MRGIERKLTDLLSRYPIIKLAILFGSQASGDVRPDSDIDVALLADTPLSADLKMELIEAIGTACGRPVDVVDMFQAPEPVLGEVFKGRKLVGTTSAYAELLTRHLINSADFIPIQQRILAERRDAWINR